MPHYQALMWGLKAVWLCFVFAYGACIGSLINVIVYRRPRGISIVTPPSRCPSCNTRLGWRDNIPVFGWLFLRGKCRYCKTAISAEYPIVEALVGILFCIFFITWYFPPSYGSTMFLGIDWAHVQPHWAHNDASVTWPTFILLLVLLSCLFAATIIDARTFTIPLELTWVPAICALFIHPIHAAILTRESGGRMLHLVHASGTLWAIPTPDVLRWDAIFAAIGGVIGIGLGLLLLRFGALRRSFADYADWERTALAEAAREAQAGQAVSEHLNGSTGAGAKGGHRLVRIRISETRYASAWVGQGKQFGQANWHRATASTSPSAAVAPALQPQGDSPITLNPSPDAPADMWIQYPFARREMVYEMLFLAPCLALMFGGLYLGRFLGGMSFNPGLQSWTLSPNSPLAGHSAPIWLVVLAGVLLGYLIGGGVVWAVRIMGSIAFGKEAMGLGDVHLMAAVGACIGWIDSTLAFFLAAFVGLFWVLIAALSGGSLRRTMPYGPYLAIATALVLLFRPLIEAALGRMAGHPVQLAP